jgi:hypothetical protein
VSTTEDRARAAMHAIAVTVHDAPPLQLGPAGDLAPARDDMPAADEARAGSQRPRRLIRRRPGGAARPGRNGRDHRPWSLLAPAAAAVTVVVVAIALVIIRGIPNGSVVPPVPSASATGPGGVPRYYVALNQQATKTGAANALLVGDALTGKAIKTFTPPTGTSFQSVSGAADDRAFVVLDVAHPNNSPNLAAYRWYEVKLAPGTAHPATLTRLPVGSRFTQVVATALSGSGQELAVAGVLSGSRQRGVEVFSLATGRLLHDWSTSDATALIPASWMLGASQFPLLTWIDGDRAITFTTISQPSPSDTAAGYKETVRRLNVSEPRSGDLMADSKVIWFASTASNSADPPCELLPPLVSADGNAISCSTFDIPSPSTATGTVSFTLTFSTYHLSAATATGLGPIAYQLTERGPGGGVSLSTVPWSSPNGATLIGEWATASEPSKAATPSPSGATPSPSGATPSPGGAVASGSASVTLSDPAGLRPAHIGVISHGKFTPLRLPPGFFAVPAPDIAW